jgi:transposase
LREAKDTQHQANECKLERDTMSNVWVSPVSSNSLSRGDRGQNNLTIPTAIFISVVALNTKLNPCVVNHLNNILLKRPENLTDTQSIRLADLLQYNLKSVRSYLMKESFQLFWQYTSPHWAGRFLDQWCTETLRSKIEPMKKIARMLRTHRPLLLNWFRAKGQLSSGIVEGFNTKAKLTTRKAFGFRTYHAIEIALYHVLGALPEPESTHRFC